jgi:hypothetical protein
MALAYSSTSRCTSAGLGLPWILHTLLCVDPLPVLTRCASHAHGGSRNDWAPHGIARRHGRGVSHAAVPWRLIAVAWCLIPVKSSRLAGMTGNMAMSPRSRTVLLVPAADTHSSLVRKRDVLNHVVLASLRGNSLRWRASVGAGVWCGCVRALTKVHWPAVTRRERC